MQKEERVENYCGHGSVDFFGTCETLKYGGTVAAFTPSFAAFIIGTTSGRNT